MALETSSSREALVRIRATHPLAGLLENRLCGDVPTLLSDKPAPGVLELAAHRLGDKPAGCWAFEDSQHATA